MYFKRLLIATALSLSLVGCASKGGASGGGEPKAKTKLFTDIADFLETRGVTVTALSYIDSISDDKVIYTDSFAGDSEYYPYFEFTVEGDVVEEALAALKTAEWTVPDEASEYGYECINKEETIEVDITYNDEDDLEYDVHAGTDFVIYSYADITGGEEYDDVCGEIALAIATNIYGDDQAAIEENMVVFLFYYYVYVTVDGTDLVAAVNGGVSYLPTGYTQLEEITTGTETEEDGSTYDYACAYYAYDGGVVVEVLSYLSEEEGKTDIVFTVAFDDESYEDEDGGETSELIYEEVENQDGSITVNIDFSKLGNQGVFEGCASWDWTVGITHSADSYNAPTYLDNGEALRLYHETGLMFLVESEFRIVEIKFTSISASSKTILVDDTNLIVTNGTYAVNNNEVTITPEEDKTEVNMDLNIGSSGHIAFSTLSFTYIAR